MPECSYHLRAWTSNISNNVLVAQIYNKFQRVRSISTNFKNGSEFPYDWPNRIFALNRKGTRLWRLGHYNRVDDNDAVMCCDNPQDFLIPFRSSKHRPSTLPLLTPLPETSYPLSRLSSKPTSALSFPSLPKLPRPPSLPARSSQACTWSALLSRCQSNMVLTLWEGDGKVSQDSSVFEWFEAFRP